MTDDGVITNKMLLEHMQAGQNSLRRDIGDLKKEFERLEEKMDLGFTEARKHREDIQEDLNATIQMQYRHEKELAVLTGRPQPEDY